MEKRINPDFPKRPARYKVDALKEIGTARISAELKHIAGIKDSFIMGPQSYHPCKTISGLLVNGIDQIDWTLQLEDLIIQHEIKVEDGFPWLSLKSDA